MTIDDWFMITGDWVLICLDWTEDEALDDPDIKEIDGEGEAGMGEGPWCICCCCDIPYGTPCTAIIEWLEGAPIPGAGDLRILIWLKWTKRDKIIYSKQSNNWRSGTVAKLSLIFYLQKKKFYS